MKAFFKKIHNDNFKWYDFFVFPLIMSYILITSMVAGNYALYYILSPFLTEENRDFLSIFATYLMFFAIWVAFFIITLLPHNKPIRKAISSFCKGNNFKNLLVGYILGLALNSACIVSALLHGDIHLYFKGSSLVRFVLLFFAVFIQSSAEELICRGFLYQRLKKGYRSPLMYVIGNAVLFSVFHLGNPGINLLALVNIVLIGIVFSLMVYYFDSIWMAMAFHAAWNFNQNIIFGLPNSGLVSPVSIFGLDASTAVDSFAYNVGFGVESTIVAAVISTITIIVLVYLGKKRNIPSTDIWNSNL